MGYWTWNFADTGRSMGYGGYKKPLYLLIPKEFLSQFGGKNLSFTYYDGYGEVGNGEQGFYDAYDLVADWNKDSITDEFVDSLGFCKNIVRAYKDGGEAGVQKYISTLDKGSYLKTEWKRNIGIAIACEDEQHSKIKFPLRFSRRDVPYETLSGTYSSNTQ